MEDRLNILENNLKEAFSEIYRGMNLILSGFAIMFIYAVIYYVILKNMIGDYVNENDKPTFSFSINELFGITIIIAILSAIIAIIGYIQIYQGIQDYTFKYRDIKKNVSNKEI